MTAPRIELVTFDAGGTLIFPHPSVGHVYAEVLAEHGVQADPQELDAAFHKAYARLTALPLDERGDDDKAFWRTAVRETFGPDRLPDGERFESVFEALYAGFASAARWRLEDGAEALLRTLKGRGYRLALLSNADTRFRQVFGELGLTPLFEALYISGELGVEKPDVRIFRHVEAALGVAPEACLHVGDSALHDQRGAQGAGWRCWLLDPPRITLDGLLEHLP